VAPLILLSLSCIQMKLFAKMVYAEALTGKRFGPGRPFIKVLARFSSRIIDCFGRQ
jgi:hypothetical protein